MDPLPSWILPRTTPDEGTSKIEVKRSRRGGSSSARRALSSFTAILERILTYDSSADAGLLQRVDPRAKLIAFAGLLVAVSFVHSAAALGLCLLGCLLCASVSRVPLRRLAEWLPAPVLFTAIIAAPAMLNVITKGRSVLTLHRFTSDHFGPWSLPGQLAITDAGLVTAGRLIMRVGACVSIVALLALTTRRHRLLQSLRALAVPGVFVAVLEMMERYLEVLVRAAQQVHLAKLSRTIKPRGLRDEHAWVAAGLGSLFRRSRSLAESVHLAMLSRGFTGDYRVMDEQRFRLQDAVFIAGVAVFAALLLLMGQVA